MAKKLKIGDRLHGYRITKVFGPGMMAISYGAQDEHGQKVFLKQYKSPAPTVVWYRKFLEYQEELSQRVSNTRAAHFAVRQIDAFEEEWGGRCYFQVYEFVEKGADLQQIFDQERQQHLKSKQPPARTPAIWSRHVSWAKVLVSGVAALHGARLVHADLKPANVYLISDPTIELGYQLKLIDMDFSLLADQRAPWHGFQGYIGSDNYRSPEHLAKGSVPGPSSDVFTTSLILYELLSGNHPYWREDQTEYAKLVQSHAVEVPRLLRPLPPPAHESAVAALLHRALSPQPSERPSAEELGAALKGRQARTGARIPEKTATQGKDREVPDNGPDERMPTDTIVSQRLELSSGGGQSLQIGVRTELGRHLLSHFGPDSDFWDARQCLLDRDPRSCWTVSPISGTANETLVNGEAVTEPRTLKVGDTLAVGRQAKRIVKLPLTVRGI